jgi:hypothetical protein
MQKYQDVVLRTNGDVAVGATVTVQNYPSGTAATIYSDNGVTLAANPLTTDANGRFAFYAASGHYTLVVNIAGGATLTYPDILLGDPAVPGYGVGTGGTVAQITSKSTGVTLNKPTGQITMNNAALAAGAIVTFVLTNSAIAANDILVVNANFAGGNYDAWPVISAAGSVSISMKNNSAGPLSEAVVLQFAVIKGAIA